MSAAKSNTIRFNKNIITVKDVIQVPTLLSTITFYIVLINTSLLIIFTEHRHYKSTV
jgi:hypothetical protein